MIQYAEVLTTVKPLEDKMKTIQTRKVKAERRIKQCSQELNDLNNKVETLKTDFESQTLEAEELNQELQKAIQMLEKA